MSGTDSSDLRCRTAIGAMALALVSVPATVRAQDSTTPPAGEEPKAGEKAPVDPRQIVVIGDRTMVAALSDVPVEQTYDEEAIASYAADSVGDLLDQLKVENGDEDPTLLVNGRPIGTNGEIASFPPEAIARVEALPRGAAVRVGGTPGQRAYNIVLKRSTRVLAGTAGYQVATEGGWDNRRAEGQVTWVREQDRINLSVRTSKSGLLLESERPVIPYDETLPYAPAGNVVSISTVGEIDPALSAAAGRTVTQAAVPAGKTTPTLADFAARANTINPSERAQYRSLRNRSKPWEVSLSGNKTLAEWLSLSFNGRLGWTDDRGFFGLPSARFTIPSSNQFSPFGRPVSLALNDPTRPLQSRSKSEDVSLSNTFNATSGTWRGTLVGRHDDRDRSYAYDLAGSLGASATVSDTTNPFAGSLARLIPVSTSFTNTRTISSRVDLDLEGPLAKLPAGDVRARLGAGLARDTLDGSNSTGGGDRSFRRSEKSARGGLTIPLTDTVGFGHGLGGTTLSLDAGLSDQGRFGTLHQYSVTLDWDPAPFAHVVLSQSSEQRAASPELLASPVLITPNVSYYDVVTGQTQDVTLVNGGIGILVPQKQRQQRASLTLRPAPKYGLAINVDYIATDLYNTLGSLPPPSAAVYAAFPERFQRDASGRLILVDQRTVNFERQKTQELRGGINLSMPLYDKNAKRPPVVRRPGEKVVSRPLPRPTLQFSVNYTHLLESSTVIRKGLSKVDLLEGGAIGLGGGRPRDSANFSLGVTDRGTGVRASGNWRGRSYLVTGTTAAPDRLVFNPYADIDVRGFVELGTLVPGSRFAKGTRLTVGIENVFDKRQTIRNGAGVTPVSYQPIYRDPIGRMVTFELRKSF